jgi:UV DNA damage endonuclease
MGLGRSCKIQIHVGGVYGDKRAGIQRFAARFAALDPPVAERIVIENDEHSFCLDDCLSIHERTGVPVVLDTLHHTLLNRGESIAAAVCSAAATWRKEDGPPIVDFSLQQAHARKGRHAGTIDPAAFVAFLRETAPVDFDLMLEIKDKEESALEALRLVGYDRRLAGDAIAGQGRG